MLAILAKQLGIHDARIPRAKRDAVANLAAGAAVCPWLEIMLAAAVAARAYLGLV